jgi:hypothetical protein
VSITIARNLIFFGVLFAVLNALAYFRYTLVNPYLWIALAIEGYVICTSGVVFTMQHAMPMFRFDTD